MAGGDGPAADHWWHPVEADVEAGSIVHMFGGTDDPFELVCNDGGGGGGATGQSELVSCSILQSSPAIPEHGLPPSEDVMASWLYPIIVSGRHRAPDDGPTMTKEPAMVMGTMMTTESSKGKLPTTDVIFGAKNTLENYRNDRVEKEKASGGSSSSRNKGPAAHNITEKRRRGRIAEKLRTLQQLVPGCDNKSSQASTLDQTVRYMRSLQQHVQSMSTSWQAPPAAMHPIVLPPPAGAALMPMLATGTFRFRPGVVPIVPYPYYHTLLMPAGAPAAPLYPAASAGASAAALDEAVYHAQCSVSTEQQQHQHKEKGWKVSKESRF